MKLLIFIETMIFIFLIVSCSSNKKTNTIDLSTFVKNTKGLSLTEINNRKSLKISEEFSSDNVSGLINVLRYNRIDFEFYDMKYPSPSDPGAYLAYSLQKTTESDKWNMTLGNHGWSGGIYQISDSTIVIQLKNLIKKGLLKEIQISSVAFFSHYEFENADANRKENELIQDIHLNK